MCYRPPVKVTYLERPKVSHYSSLLLCRTYEHREGEVFPILRGMRVCQLVYHPGLTPPSGPETDFASNQREAGTSQTKVTSRKPVFKVRSVVEWKCFSFST